MNNHQSTNFFLQKIHLTGYKSIKNVEVTLQDGLNIIIGKNASGKTNFLSFLNKALTNQFDRLFDFSTQLTFLGKKNVVITTENKIDKDFLQVGFKQKNNTELKIDNEIIKEESLMDSLFYNNILYNSIFIQHGIPKNFICVDAPFSFSTQKKLYSEDLIESILDVNSPRFIKQILYSFNSFLYVEGDYHEKIEYAKNHLIECFTELNTIKHYLIKFSPIKDIRLSENFRITFDEYAERYHINNLLIEFYVNDTWFQFSDLSDGTKRLFYIISEIGSNNRLTYFDNEYRFKMVSDDIYNYKKIILIEEPELGVHPHQLHDLMNFLKEMGEQKQIIITTHSPMVLDILEAEELDKIIITSINKKEGTILSHLTEKQKEKAKLYMEENYLSDYWKYSDLEI